MTLNLVKNEGLFDCTNFLELFRCRQCFNFETYKLIELKWHFRLDHSLAQSEEKRYVCKNCNFITFSKFLSLTHQSNQCLKSVETKSKLSISGVKKNKSLKCNYCSHTAKRTSHLQQHILCKHTDPEQIQWFECVHCPFRTKLKSILVRHVTHKHRKKPTSDVEKKKVKLMSNVEKKNKESKLFKCEHCSYTAKRTSTLKLHVLCRHTDPEQIQWFECAHCPLKTKFKSALDRHITHRHKTVPNSDVTNKKIKLFKCDYCAHTTEWGARDLRLHVLRKHTDPDQIQWFECGHCPYKSKTKSNLRKHIVKHDDRKLIKCDQCSYETKRKCNLDDHIKAKHTDLDKMQWFECELCGHKSKTNSDLRSHIGTHNSESIKCDQCSFATKYKNTLNNHVIVKHTHPEQIQWFECAQCTFRSKLKLYLARHIVRKHK